MQRGYDVDYISLAARDTYLPSPLVKEMFVYIGKLEKNGLDNEYMAIGMLSTKYNIDITVSSRVLYYYIENKRNSQRYGKNSIVK